MFTGLVTDVGRVAAIEDRDGLRRLRVESDYPVAALQPGASVMHGGVCLTLVEFGPREIPGEGYGSWWVVEAIPETLNRTTLGTLKAGDWVNLELSLKMGDELGGHLVSGHVDGLGEIVSMIEEGESWRIRIALPPELAKYVAHKGSIAVDGVSLTVAAVGGDAAAPWFEVTIIPHTAGVTTFGDTRAGQKVNLEVDLIARYVARMLEFRGQ